MAPRAVLLLSKKLVSSRRGARPSPRALSPVSAQLRDWKIRGFPCSCSSSLLAFRLVSRSRATVARSASSPAAARVTHRSKNSRAAASVTRLPGPLSGRSTACGSTDCDRKGMGGRVLKGSRLYLLPLHGRSHLGRQVLFQPLQGSPDQLIGIVLLAKEGERLLPESQVPVTLAGLKESCNGPVEGPREDVHTHVKKKAIAHRQYARDVARLYEGGQSVSRPPHLFTQELNPRQEGPRPAEHQELLLRRPH